MQHQQTHIIHVQTQTDICVHINSSLSIPWHDVWWQYHLNV